MRSRRAWLKAALGLGGFAVVHPVQATLSARVPASEDFPADTVWLGLTIPVTREEVERARDVTRLLLVKARCVEMSTLEHLVEGVNARGWTAPLDFEHIHATYVLKRPSGKWFCHEPKA